MHFGVKAKASTIDIKRVVSIKPEGAVLKNGIHSDNRRHLVASMDQTERSLIDALRSTAQAEVDLVIRTAADIQAQNPLVIEPAVTSDRRENAGRPAPALSLVKSAA